MSKTNCELDLNPLFLTAIDTMENTGDYLFITGRAGTGKSKLLEYFRSQTNKQLVVLAPTGIFAINVDGQTIHSFFKFRPETTIDTIKSHIIGKQQSKIYQQLEMIIIDECDTKLYRELFLSRKYPRRNLLFRQQFPT